MSQKQYGKLESDNGGVFSQKHYDGCAAQPCEPKPKLPQVIQAIKDLADAVDQMEKEFGMLHDKLSIITSPQTPPENIGCGTVPGIPIVELAMSINANVDRVRMLRRAMRSLGERIEL